MYDAERNVGVYLDEEKPALRTIRFENNKYWYTHKDTGYQESRVRKSIGESLIFKFDKLGRPVVWKTMSHKYWKGIRFSTHNFCVPFGVRRNDELTKEFLVGASNLYGIDPGIENMGEVEAHIRVKAYPQLQHTSFLKDVPLEDTYSWGVHNHHVPLLLTLPFRHVEVRDAVTDIFGQYDKKILKFYGSCIQDESFDDMSEKLSLMMAANIMGIHPHAAIDAMQDYEEGSLFYSGYGFNKRDVTNFLKRISAGKSPARKMRFFREIMDADNYIINDTLRMLRQHEGLIHRDELYGGRYVSIEEFHDNLSVMLRGQLSSIDREPVSFEFYDDLKPLEDIKVDGMQVVLPKNADHLQKWSRRLNNCIWSYAYHIGPDNFVFGLNDGDGKIKVNAEYSRSYGITQCSVFGNQPVPAGVKEKLNKKVKKAMSKINKEKK